MFMIGNEPVVHEYLQVINDVNDLKLVELSQ